LGISPGRTFWAIVNLFALIASGISVSWWILYYTDFFPIFGGLLGLGGLFTWIAFVSNILTADRKEELQRIFDQYVLQQHFLIHILFLFLAWWWLYFAPTRSALLVDSLESTIGHVIELWEFQEQHALTTSPLVKRVKLSSSETAKVLLSTPWFGSKKYLVKVKGYPAIKITVRSFRREPLFIPKMLLDRPVLLIRPEARDLGAVAEEFRLDVFINDSWTPTYTLHEYHGQALWLGADAEVDVPKELIDRWRLEFKSAGMYEEDYMKWLHPDSLDPVVEFSGSTKITVNLKNKGGKIKYSGDITTQPSGNALQFPEEIILHFKKEKEIIRHEK